MVGAGASWNILRILFVDAKRRKPDELLWQRRHWDRQRSVLLEPHTLLTALSCSKPHAYVDQTIDTSERCAECGGPTQAGWTCWEQPGLLIAWEFDDPDLRSEHFLTVACYNLQHPAQFRDMALAGLRASFVAHLDHALSVADIRRRTASATAGATRVLRDAAERRPVLKRWSMTTADVYLLDRPTGGASRVRAWAASIQREM